MWFLSYISLRLPYYIFSRQQKTEISFLLSEENSSNKSWGLSSWGLTLIFKENSSLKEATPLRIGGRGVKMDLWDGG